MTVLRSGEIIPIIRTKSSRKTVRKAVGIAPMTPSKTVEPSNNPLFDGGNTSPGDSAGSPELLRLGLGGSGSGTVDRPSAPPRRSLRLSSTSSSGEAAENSVPRGKRKVSEDSFGTGVEVLGSVIARESGQEVWRSLRSGKKAFTRRGQGSSCGGGVSDGVDLPKVDYAKEDRLDSGMMEREARGSGSGSYKGKRGFSREEKKKGKLSNDALVINVFDQETNVSRESDATSDDAGVSGIPNLSSYTPEQRRLSREEKGKGKLIDIDLSLSLGSTVELALKPQAESAFEGTLSGATSVVVLTGQQNGGPYLEGGVLDATKTRGYKERFKDIARKNASRFAHFPSQEEEEEHTVDEAEREIPQRAEDKEPEDWPGPFSTAMRIINDRKLNTNARTVGSTLTKKTAPILWVPKKDSRCAHSKTWVQSLQDLCMDVLVKNADAIDSLDCVPDVLRHKLTQLLCNSRRMNGHFLNLLVSGSPTEICVRDCSWLTEEEFTKAFDSPDLNNLTVLQLDQCGRCLPDYIIFSTLARSSNFLPVLTTVSLKGACRLSDAGLSALVSSARELRSINLSQCSLLTSDGIYSLANTLGSSLKELYLDDCESIDAMLVLPSLLKLEWLEVLSVAGIQTVCDDFIKKFVAERGHNMKELVLANCTKLTDASIKAIAETCSGLCMIDISNLCRLTDTAIGHLANGCQAIQKLKLCRSVFSDEAVAAYLEACGEPLKELSLNNVNKVAENTAISLAKQSRNLLSLDLSWCRNLTNEALGLIVDSCLSLKMLKLFGCTQITNVLLDGHSNPLVKIIGLKMSPIFQHLEVPDLLVPLQYSSVGVH